MDDARVYFEDEAGEGAPVVFYGGFGEPIKLVRASPLGQLNGFRVRYVTDGSTQVLEIPNFQVEMCGASGEYCDD